MTLPRFAAPRVLFALILTAGLLVGCDSNDADTDEPRRISYPLSAQSNSGALPSGVGGTVTFWEAGDTQTIVTLQLDGDTTTNTSVSHPAHIHANSASDGGDIQLYLSPIDGSGGGGTSARVIDRSLDDLADFDGYVNIHQSLADLNVVVSQGNIGANASGNTSDGLDLVDDPRSRSYSLSAQPNNGTAVPNGVGGTVTFKELTDEMTLVTLDLNAGATGASVSHPAHIHQNRASEGGSIQYYLSPVDATDSDSRSSKIVGASYDELVGFDGYVNVHESVANLGTIISQGNIGTNAGGSDGGGGDGGY